MSFPAPSDDAMFDRSNSRLDVRQLLILLILFAVLQAFSVLKDVSPILEGAYVGTDTYGRMVRVQDVLERGDWFDSRYERVNPPDGHTAHWTRPMDGLILAAYAMLRPFLDEGTALYWAGALISPVLHLATVLVIYLGLRGIFGRDWAFICSILFTVQPSVSQAFLAGRPDHHALQHLLTMLSLILTLHLLHHPFSRRLCLITGVVFVSAVWTSVETILPVFGCLCGLGLAWLVWRRDLARKNLFLAAGAAAGGIAALFLERGGAGFVGQFAELDRYSMFYLLLFVLLLAFWAALFLWDRYSTTAQTIVARGAVAAFAGTIALIFLWWFNPVLFSGGGFQTDPLYFNTRTIFIREGLPIVSENLIREFGVWAAINRFLAWFGFIVPGVIFLVLLVSRPNDPDRPLWLCIAVTLATVMLYDMAHGKISYRHIPVIELIVLFPYTELVVRLYRRLSGIEHLWGSLVRITGLFALAFWPLLFSGARAPQVTKAPNLNLANLSESARCDRGELIRFVASDERWKGAPRRIMAHADFGPEIMFRTPHSVFSIPNHRRQPGYDDTFHALTAKIDATALAIIERRKVDLIVMCRNGAIAQQFHRNAYSVESEEAVFSERLLAGEIPSWLEQIALPDDLDNRFLVLAVKRNETQ